MKTKSTRAPIMDPNPDGDAPPMPIGPGAPVKPGDPAPGGTELPGFHTVYLEILRSILVNPSNPANGEGAVKGYVELAVVATRSYFEQLSRR